MTDEDKETKRQLTLRMADTLRAGTTGDCRRDGPQLGLRDRQGLRGYVAQHKPAKGRQVIALEFHAGHHERS